MDLRVRVWNSDAGGAGGCYTGVMTFEIVVTGPDDFPAITRPGLIGFGRAGIGSEQLEDIRRELDVVRMLGARIDGEWVGTIGDFPFELTLPGGATVPVAGATWAAVLPTHRRRGILSALMGRLLDDTVERGWPAATLLASEAGIYPRFGFGVACGYSSFRFDPRHVGLGADVASIGSLELVADPTEAVATAAEIWDLYRVTRAGSSSRLPVMWEFAARDPEADREGFSGLMWVVHRDDAGRPDGYASYRVKDCDTFGLPHATLKVVDLVAPAPAVEAELFEYLRRVDLVRTVEMPYRPVDDHLVWRLGNRREMVTVETGDFLWLRVLDVAGLLTSRSYAVTDELVLGVDDPFRPATSGRYLLRTGPGDPECERLTDPGVSLAPASLTGGSVDLAMDVSSLASLVLGTTTPSVLAAAGRLDARPDVLARADACFHTGRAPYTNTEF